MISPPGTGKTKTILGIVGSFLTEDKYGSPLVQTKQYQGDDLPNLKRILICAPSNAAVDELVLRLKEGIVGFGSKVIHPGIVRLGRSDVINSNVRELTLEELVDKRLDALEKEAAEKFDGSLRKEQDKNLAQREALRVKQNSLENGDEREAVRLEILSLTKKIKETGHKLDLQREQAQVRARKLEIERRKAQTLIMRQSQVICATLSGSAHNVLSSLQMRFDTVIIDEAAQCIELSALIPLKYGCKQCIMVGDPNQLPPTVLSQHAASLKYEQSLFVRMFNQHPTRVHMLNVQFRMHPEIAMFPSREFYDKKLATGSTNFDRTTRDWHSSAVFTPYRFFNVQGVQEKSQQTKSLFNRSEAQTIFQFYKALQNALGHEAIAGKVGIISPYKQQVALLKKVFESQLGMIAAKDIDFNTIDGFQGQEKDIIMISCVRAEQDAHGVGFLSDTRRMNVAITRAKSALWIFGNQQSLVKNPVWKRLVEDAKSRGMFTDCKPGFMNSSNRDEPSRPVSNSSFSERNSMGNKRRHADSGEGKNKKDRKDKGNKNPSQRSSKYPNIDPVSSFFNDNYQDKRGINNEKQRKYDSFPPLTKNPHEPAVSA